jgi:hypothetical protein
MARVFYVLVLFLLAQSVGSGRVLANEAEAFRHALIIGVAVYRDEEVPPLFGVPNDMDSAREIAAAMGIPAANITELFNEKATKANIIAELRKLSQNKTDGGRILIYFSGHGTRWRDGNSGGCVEGLLTWDREVIVNREFAQFARPLGLKADKLIIMFDACHSGGIAGIARNTRSIGGDTLSPKFFLRADATSAACSKPSNVRTRNLIGPAQDGVEALPENVVHIMSARPDEVSFDEPSRGGLATQAVKRCLLGGAADTDASGGVSLAEVEECSQGFIREKVARFPDLLPHHISISGLRNLVPVAMQGGGTKPSAEAVRQEKERLAIERQQAEQRQRLEEEKIAAQRAEQVQREQARVAEERARAEAEQARLAAERAEAEKQREAAARLEAENQRLAAERAEQAKREQARLAEERVRIEAEQARLAKEQAEAEKQRLAAERAEKAKREQERLAQERARAEAEQARLAAERAEAERARLAALRLEAEKQRLVAERLEQVRLEQERLAAEAALAAAAQTAALTTGPNVVVAQEPIPVIAPVGPLAALKDIYAQRDTRRTVSVSMPRDTLRINQDMFTMTVTSSHAGFVYVLLLGSDETSFYMLFPNALDQTNRIEANKSMRLPRPHWGVNAAGPPGTDQLLVIVTETARDLSVLPSAVTSAENPFTLTPADIGGRRQLVDFVIGTGVSGASRFGASWTTVKEVR